MRERVASFLLYFVVSFTGFLLGALLPEPSESTKTFLLAGFALSLLVLCFVSLLDHDTYAPLKRLKVLLETPENEEKNRERD